jgi:hypothetical protein
MSNPNYWKDKYKDFWDDAAKKEENVKKLIEKECKCKCRFVGLGAGSTNYLPGSAKLQGFKKGGSDLHVEGTSIFIEVTGPNTDRVGEDAALWIRPDKIQNALADSENDHWVVHVLKKNAHMRTVHMNEDLKIAFKKGELKIITPTIRCAEEKYVEIPAASKYVEEIGSLVIAIQKAIEK